MPTPAPRIATSRSIAPTARSRSGRRCLQPDGRVYRFGATPLKRSWLRFSRYQHGGGVIGNVPRGTLNVMKTSIPYVSQVTNREPAMGGRDAQTLDDAKLRAPQMLRTRTRAVTAEDYEYLALQVPGVARAHCLTPGAVPASPGDLQPGQVVVLVLPQLPESDSRNGTNPSLERPELLRAVHAHLDERRVVGARLEVRAPRAVDVSVEVTLRVSARAEPYVLENVRRAAERALYTYLSPYTGGPDGKAGQWVVICTFRKSMHVCSASLASSTSTKFASRFRSLIHPTQP